MSKVKLIVFEGYGSDRSPFVNNNAEVTSDLQVPETYSIQGLVRTDFDGDKDGSRRTSDELLPVIDVGAINHLVGRIMTLADSMFSDKEQRKAAKDLLMRELWDWHGAEIELLTEPWRKDKFPNYKKAFDKE